MTIRRGFVRSIEARSDGWVEVVLVSVHAGNTTTTLLIENLDGDLTQVHRRLAKLALLRDALARTLPVEVDFDRTDEQGDVLRDVTILRTRSILGRQGSWWIEAHVIGLAVRERGPEKDASPYTDEPDEATAALLLDDGSVASYDVDLQRPHEGTGHALLEMLAEARRTRRTLRLYLAPEADKEGTQDGGFIVGAAWPTLESCELQEEIAFIERLGQRYECLDAQAPELVERVWVKYTTAPDQNPEGDISENGSFVPESKEAWVHQDSPLLGRLLAALRDSLQVKLGLHGKEIHAVELISHLGSAARPIWITFGGETLCEEPKDLCVNEPTVQQPSRVLLDSIPRVVAWRGTAFFNEGIWRFVVCSADPVELKIDGEEPCAELLAGDDMERMCAEHRYTNAASTIRPEIEKGAEVGGLMAHAYLNGVHEIEFIVRGRACGSPFRALIYRIR